MRTLGFIPAVSILALVGCGAGQISVSISPQETTVNAGGTVQFSAGVGSAGNKTVLWSATAGTITSGGLFTAPILPGTCSVVATSEADPSKTATATVTVVTPIAVSPSLVNLQPNATQTFSAVILETGDGSVTWSIQEGAAGGTITATGVYTAPGTGGTFHVVATSIAHPGQTGTAVVTVSPAL
jgi:hypothetical protein